MNTKNLLTTFVGRLRPLWSFWLASFAHSPGLSRDVGLVAGADADAAPRSVDLAVVVPARSPADRQLAEELLWGPRLNLSDPPAHFRM